MSDRPTARPDRNSELMKMMGSKTGRYDPESPDQWLYLLHHGDPHERALAWIKSKTIAWSRSPFCVDEHGKPLYLESMAADLGWKIQTARNVVSDLVTQGRARLEKGKRIWYRAEVPVSDRIDKQPIPVTHSYWPPYVIDSIKTLPAEKRAAFDAETKQIISFEDASFAELVAGHRAVMERVKDSMLRAYGTEKKKLPKRRTQEATHVQLRLLALPEFVHSYAPELAAELVQSAIPGSYEPKNGSVQTPHPYMQTQTQTTKRAAAAKLAVSHLEGALRIDAAAAQGILTRWRKDHPSITADEVVALARRKLARNPKVVNPTGLLFRYVPSDHELVTVRADAKRVQDQERRTADREARQEDETVKAAQDTLNDASATEQERQLAHEVLGTATKAKGSG